MATTRTTSEPKRPSKDSAGAAPLLRHPDRGAGLRIVVARLAGLSERELFALISAANDVPQIVPGLLAWIGHACDWELSRRARIDFPLRSPGAVIPPEEAACTVGAIMMLRARFDQDAGRHTRAVSILFDAFVRAITGRQRSHAAPS
jgi:hypothetical protein